MIALRLTLFCLLVTIGFLHAQNRDIEGPIVTGMDPADLADFSDNPPAVQNLLTHALALTRQNLGYKFGSSEPENGGMDCSGTIFHLLREVGVKDVPRSSDQQYVWVRKAGVFQTVLSSKPDSFELDKLRPGDLLFWTGTYNANREIPITHTMIYLGRAASDQLPLMVGASDGRTLRGKKQFGVSVFEFRLPDSKSISRFVGYASIPGLMAAAPRPPAKTSAPDPEDDSQEATKESKKAATNPE